MKSIFILIDNGHSKVTKGKCSPDRSFYEWEFNRKVSKRLAELLRNEGIEHKLLVPEDAVEISLSERARRANEVASLKGTKNCLFISIHSNAAGADGKWHNASGFSVFVSPKASTNSKRCARIFTEEAEKMKLMGNRAIPSEKYWVGDFTVLNKTSMPAVLTENGFYDNQKEVEFLKSDEGIDKYAELHLRAIKRYMELQK